MTIACANTQPQGFNKSCLKHLESIVGFGVVPIGDSIAGIGVGVDIATWIAKINALTLWIPGQLLNYERTTDDPTINTAGFGKKITVRNGIPSMVAYLDSNPCAYNAVLNAVKGGVYGLYLILEDGNIMVWRSLNAETLNPFTARISARADIPVIDAVENGYPLYINFDNRQEFEKYTLIKPTWNPIAELPLAMPSGYQLIPIGTYSAGDVDVMVLECGDGVTGLTDSEFEALSSSNIDTPSITAVTDNGAGKYTLTLQKGSTPANLVSGDYIDIRVKVLDSTTPTYVSNTSRINGAT